jgi:hypothetical protein
VPLTLHVMSRARPRLIAAAGHQRGTLPLHRRACILLPPAPHFALTPYSYIPFRNRSLRLASRHTFSSLTILSTPNPSKHAARPHSFSKSSFSASQFPLVLTLSSPNFLLCKISFKRAGRAFVLDLCNCIQFNSCKRPECDVPSPSQALLSHSSPTQASPTLAGGLPSVTLGAPPA